MEMTTQNSSPVPLSRLQAELGHEGHKVERWNEDEETYATLEADEHLNVRKVREMGWEMVSLLDDKAHIKRQS